VAGGRAHDGDHLAGGHGIRGGGRDVGVDVADGHRDALGQTGPGGEVAGHRAELADLVLDLVLDEALEGGVERGQVVARRVGAVLTDALVAGGAGVAHVLAAQLPDDPVGRLDPRVHARVDLRVLLDELQRLRVLPLRGDEASVAGKPRLAALPRDRVDAVRLGLPGVVLPQLDVGVGAVAEAVDLAQRGAVGEHGQRGRCGEVGRDSDDERGVDPGVPDRLRHGAAQDLAIVVRVLERPLGRQGRPRGRERRVHHRVFVLVHGRAEFGAVAHAHDERAPGERAVVDADHVAIGPVRYSIHGAASLRFLGKCYR